MPWLQSGENKLVNKVELGTSNFAPRQKPFRPRTQVWDQPSQLFLLFVFWERHDFFN